ncbi:MAG: branched-chain amino acid ABC transporter permease [Gammaproteobacteria bacterium]|nr:branched-chain amino acid ABC transporter permease [Gammaproteobacteria bacterium]
MELLHPTIILQFIIGGLLAGALYTLLACGLNLVFGVMRVINLAHAELMLAGSFGAYALFSLTGLHPLLSLPVVLVVLFACGCFLQLILVERTVGKGELVSLMVTYGLSIILMNIGLLLFTSDFKSIPVLQGALVFGDIVVSKPRGVAGLVAIILTLAVYLFLQYSRLGKAIRATAEHPEVATICGIDVVKIRMLTFGLATAMAGAAGVMLTMIYSFSPETGADFILKCFAIIIIGGMGNFIGAFYGAILLGLAEAFVAGFASTQWAEAVAYLLLVLVLLIRPTGLKGMADAR